MHCMDRDLSNEYTVIHSINIWGLEQGINATDYGVNDFSSD